MSNLLKKSKIKSTRVESPLPLPVDDLMARMKLAERNDCTVTALTMATKLPYADCWAIAKKAGRKPAKAFVSSRLVDAFNKTNRGTLKSVGRPFITIKQFIKLNPKGAFYARRSKHAFAIIDGKVKNERSDRRIITDAWVFVPPTA